MSIESRSDTDTQYMRAALRLARRGLGQVAPNPSVGCVLVRDDRIVGRGWTQTGGRPHAETEALHRAGDMAAGATAYVSLEPCSHHGKTPPCAEALSKAGVARVVFAMADPDPRVKGRGAAHLTAAGIKISTDVCAAEARAINMGFVSKVVKERPYVTLKLATSLDGRIATARGESKWITGASARAWGHLLRRQNDVILIGAGTLRSDNPSLNCRLPGMTECSPLPVVIANSGEGLSDYDVMNTGGEESAWLFCGAIEPTSDETLTNQGVQVKVIGNKTKRGVDVGAVLTCLAKNGFTRVLVEGGGKLTASFLDQDLVDEIQHFHAGLIIGGDGLPAIGSLAQRNLQALNRFQSKMILQCDKDYLEILRKPD